MAAFSLVLGILHIKCRAKSMKNPSATPQMVPEENSEREKQKPGAHSLCLLMLTPSRPLLKNWPAGGYKAFGPAPRRSVVGNPLGYQKEDADATGYVGTPERGGGCAL